jgi:hypothetical protein
MTGAMTSPPRCCECSNKDTEIEYLKALLALNGIQNSNVKPEHIKVVTIKQQQAIIRQQLSLIRADVQYMNRHIQSVLQWITKVISVFLQFCGRVNESTASTIVHSASSVISDVSAS